MVIAMEVYIGMDISMQETSICGVKGDGSLVFEGVAPSEPAAIASYLRKAAKDFSLARIIFETGPLSTHFYHELKMLGFPVVCVDARHAHGVLKAQRIKTDRNDARGLAQISRTGWYKAVHIKSTQSNELRNFMAGRKQILEARLTLENHIRGTLKTYGIKLGTVSAADFARKVKALTQEQTALSKRVLQGLLEVRETMLEQEKELTRQCKKLAQEDEDCRRMMTVPGIGVITALSFKAEIDDPSRFRHSRDVGVHLGLTPRKYASGEIDRNGGISKCGNADLRTLLFESALVLLARSKKWSRLKAWGVKLAQRSCFKTACTAVARKLAVILHRIWTEQTEFVYGKEVAA